MKRGQKKKRENFNLEDTQIKDPEIKQGFSTHGEFPSPSRREYLGHQNDRLKLLTKYYIHNTQNAPFEMC